MVVHSRSDEAKELLDALGIGHLNVRAIDVELTIGDVLRVTVEYFPTPAQIKAGAIVLRRLELHQVVDEEIT